MIMIDASGLLKKSVWGRCRQATGEGGDRPLLLKVSTLHILSEKKITLSHRFILDDRKAP